jgi:hypothetical protein
MTDAVQLSASPQALPLSNEELFMRRTTQRLNDSKEDLEVGQAKKAKGEKALGKFVSYFYSFMLQKMQETVPDGPFNGGRAEKIFQQQINTEMGERMSEAKQNNKLNPLTRELVNTYLGKLDNYIEKKKSEIDYLEKILIEKTESASKRTEDMKAPLNEVEVFKELDKQLSATTQKLEELKKQEAGRQPVKIKVGSEKLK